MATSRTARTSINPYLKDGRLPEVIAAITALGNYRYYKLDFAQCAERIANSPGEAEHWGRVLTEHPEFFRVDQVGKKASLVWRRQNPRVFDPKRFRELSSIEFQDLSKDQLSHLSRKPLASSEITALIGVAVNLHDRALEQHKARTWWLPIVLTTVLAFAGATAGTLASNWLTHSASGGIPESGGGAGVRLDKA